MPTKQPADPTVEPSANFSVRSLITLIGGTGAIGIFLAVAVSAIRVARAIQWRPILLGLDGMRLPLVLLASVLVGLIFLVAWLRPRWRTLGISFLGLILIAVSGAVLFRIESFYGNLVPRLTWRWAPTAEEQFADWQLDRASRTATTTVTAPAAFPVIDEEDFPGFLGAERTGVIRHIQLDPNWSQRPPQLLWRRAIGLGWSGFAVAGGLAITQEQRGELELVVAYDLTTGSERWVHADEVRFVDEHGDGPRATPTVAEGRVYALGGTGLLSCLDALSGELIWQQETLSDPEKQNLLWGMAGSPLVVDGRVMVTPGGGPDRALVAYEARSGQLAFSGGDDPAAYASPAEVQIAGQRQLLSFNGAGLRGFSIENGQPLWLFPWITQGERQRVNVAQPLVVQPSGTASPNESFVLISSGYDMGMVLLRVALEQDDWQVTEVWHSRALKSKMSNFVVHAGHIYGFDSGILTCLDLNDGRRLWKRGRYGHGQILLVDDLLLIQAESGEVVLVQAAPDRFRELATLDALSDKTWNNVALAGRVLVVRNDREAAAFELPERNGAPEPAVAQALKLRSLPPVPPRAS